VLTGTSDAILCPELWGFFMEIGQPSRQIGHQVCTRSRPDVDSRKEVPMRRTSITRRTRTYLHPLRIAPPGMRPTGPELPWLEETGPHRPSSPCLTLTLALLVIALLVPMRNANAAPAPDAPDEAPEERESGGSWAELFGLPGVYHAGCLEPLAPESPAQLCLPIVSRSNVAALTARGETRTIDARIGFPPTG
jgi:hypothetical protein